jgi:hypothetical protein
LAPLDFVGNSLRFRSSASAYLNRTFTTPTNNLKWTWSAWIKRGTLSVANVPFGAGDGSSNNFGNLQFTTSDTLQFAQINAGSYNVQMITSAVFRDPAAWYHIQVVYDSANATSTDRVQIYVNGVRQSVTYSTGPFAQNTASKINSAIAHYISKLDYTTVYFDGYQTEVNFIDGQALTPSSFGTINSYGVWQPITYGGSYGTNGFYLPFSQTAPAGTPAVSASYLVVAGGGGAAGTGGGSAGGGGGGGAGGFLTGTTSIAPTSTYTVTVGAGGAAGAATANGSQGVNSVFSSITSIGGGGGGAGTSGAGGNGGSGGGGNGSNAVGVTLLGGIATSGQGFNGGNGASDGDEGGGGGGASAVGTAGVNLTSRGNGGAGTASSISGSSVTYAGGGGGGGNNTAVGGTGGAGGGGSSPGSQGAGGAGTANTGGGGGGGYATSANQAGGAGGSGVVIISYAGAQVFVGGTVTSSGGNTIHTFTTSGLLIYNVTNDFSPNGNNWTPNNINVSTLGATYDSMTDVPTLTSATAANYCVLNPLDKATSFTTAGGNLNFTPANTSDLYSCRSTIQIPSTGKWIWEVTNTNSAYMITAGLLSGSTALTGQQTVSCAGMTVGAIGTFFSTTQWMNTTTTWSVTNIGNGDTLVIAYDADAGKIWFGRVASGGSTVTFYNTSGTADPSTGTDPRASGIVAGGWFAGFGTYFTPSGASANFGQRPFAFTNTPTGFVALNTYNL